MVVKGIVFVPPNGPTGWHREPPGTQQVANRPLVGLILDALAADGVAQSVVVAGDAELAALRSSIEEDAAAATEPVYLGLSHGRDLADALRRVTGFVDSDPAILHVATGLLGQTAAPIVETLAATPEDLTLMLHHGSGSGPPLGRATAEMLGIRELNGTASRLALAGVAGFGGGVVARVPDGGVDPDASVTDDDSAPAWSRQLVGLSRRIADRGLSVGAGRVCEWCEYSPSPGDLLDINRCVLDRQGGDAGRALDDRDNRIEGRVVIHPTAEVRASVILGPALIGAGARISDAYVGPYTTIGREVTIDGCEILGSIVGDGARLAHVASRIEGSTIGRGARIFRDFRLPRATRLQVGEGAEISLD